MYFSKIRVNCSKIDDILFHFSKCNHSFNPPLQTYVNIEEYAEKIFHNAVRVEYWKNKVLSGLLAVYYNDDIYKIGFITNVSVLPELHGKGIASKLLKKAVRIGKSKEFVRVNLEVMKNNGAALRLYKRNGFIIAKENTETFDMTKVLKTDI